MAQALSDDQIESALTALSDWRLLDGKVVRDYKFADFSEAFAFLTRVALVAEQRGHHPDIHNSWSAVRLELSSHDAGGITQRDIDLAAAIDALG